ncbi:MULTISPECIES: MFS transporter [unclassified Crossiella]|uniref:MFS transporter n=1 Tax=unclassified Crossiella TaxID=2620835 RepID=UPI001FFF973A|nr:MULTISPECIES: nitrate/nitrite transporter [unclassified Crossiella]MCK2243205.1 NarK/NasA family nitrate transporter [Crossiella sp. S99.2]MCK2254326.1 NarK/NasA family nitrate transporter [Crossiella sp. S99.1]
MSAQTTVRRGRWIEHWEPENPEFWASTGRRVANRNLVFSILAEHLGFSVWLLWSTVTVFLPAAGFAFSVDQLFWLVALPNLIGSVLRLPYTFAVATFGGRMWTVISAALLLVPTGMLAWCVSDPSTPYWMFVLAACTAGLGGGNFASSMANISFFFPDSRKGFALGLNAAGGNIGVAVVQLAVPLVISAGSGVHLAYAGLMWMPFVIIAGVCALFFMDSLTEARSDFRSYAASTRNRHTWVMSFLYIGTFGSFIGYSAALPLLINSTFPEAKAGYFAFLGALVGSLSRPIGGWLADRIGGGRVTLWTFLAMGAGVLGVVLGLAQHNFWLFLGSFLWLFITTGVGNGSTYRMIPAIFSAQFDDPATARRQAAAVIGIAGAVGALGGFLITRAFAMSVTAYGSLVPAFLLFLAFYGVCLAVTWWYYLRRRVFVRVPSLAHAGI